MRWNRWYSNDGLSVPGGTERAEVRPCHSENNYLCDAVCQRHRTERRESDQTQINWIRQAHFCLVSNFLKNIVLRKIALPRSGRATLRNRLVLSRDPAGHGAFFFGFSHQKCYFYLRKQVFEAVTTVEKE